MERDRIVRVARQGITKDGDTLADQGLIERNGLLRIGKDDQPAPAPGALIESRLARSTADRARRDRTGGQSLPCMAGRSPAVE